MNYFIAIDIGTSSARSIAFSTKGKVLVTKSVANTIQNPQSGWQEQNPNLILQAVKNTMQAVVQTLGAPPFGVSLCTVMHSMMAVDAQGYALTPLVIWADNRSETYAVQLKGTDLGKDIFQHTGTPIHPMSPLCKLAWWRQEVPELFHMAHKFVGIKEYVLFHLFGKWVVDYSVASATGLLDNQTLDWYAPALAFAGVAPHQLAQLVSPTFILQGLHNNIAQALNIPVDTPFIVGANDGCLANLGAMTLEPGEVTITLGTSAAIRTTSKTPTYDAQERLFSYVLTEDLFVTGGASNNGGIVYQWFAENFLESANSKEAALKAIDNINTIPVGEDELLFLPYLTGERAPIWDAQARGIFYGITKHHTKLHFQRAVLEGILYNVRQMGQALEEVTGNIQTICVNGGLSKIDTMMQLLADIFRKPIHRLDCEEGSAFGAFILGMKALGKLQHFSDAKQWVKEEQRYEPDAETQVVHQKNYEIFKKIYPVLKTLGNRH